MPAKGIDAKQILASPVKGLLVGLLLCGLLLNTAGFYVIFKVQQYRIRSAIKKEMKGHVPEDELHRISFSMADMEMIDWERTGKEFRHDGSMYDVVCTEMTGDSIHYFCINDVEEARLFASLDELVRRRMKDDPDTPGRSARKHVRTFNPMINNDTGGFHHRFSAILRSSFFWTEPYYALPFQEVLSPPPESV